MLNSDVALPGDFISNMATAGIDIFANHKEVVLANSTLRRDQHLAFDKAMVRIALETFRGINDLKAANLTRPVGNIGTTLLGYEQMTDMTGGTISMDGMVEGQNDRVEFKEVFTPLPLFRKDFWINLRQLAASGKDSTPLSTIQLEIATKKVALDIERVLYHGAPGLVVDGHEIYGYCNHPYRNTVTLSAGGWNNPGDSDVINDVVNLIQAAKNDLKEGPYIMYVHPTTMTDLQRDFSEVKGANTKKQRILQFDEITDIRSAPYLEKGDVILVQLTKDVVELAVAQDLINMEWSTNPMQKKFMVWGIMVPLIKYDANGHCGVVHGIGNVPLPSKTAGT